LQAGLGATLAALLGYFPGGAKLAAGCAVGAGAWLVMVELTHRLGARPLGARLAAIDRAVRYAVMAALVLSFAVATLKLTDLPLWLAVKFLLFAGVIACGVAIRFALIEFFRVWRDIEREGSTEAREVVIREIYVRATGVLIGLWLCIAGIVVLSVWKPV
jgi:hypothetical protein